MSRLTRQDDVERGLTVYTLELSNHDFERANLTNFDRALLRDIEHGPESTTPIADQLLGLETIVSRIEEAV